MGKKKELWVKKSLTPEMLKEFLNIFDTVGIVVLRKDEPIFSLQFSSKNYDLSITIHKGQIITEQGNPIRYAQYNDCEQKVYAVIENKPVSVGNYIKKNKYELYHSPCRKFLIDNILDPNIKSEPVYIALIRNFFRRYGILQEKRGKFKKVNEIRQERDKLIIELYQDIIRKTKRRKPLPITNIYNRLTNYEVSFSTIRRVLNNFIKK